MKPAWRRKPDGRPYVDYAVNGKRHRQSLLLPGETTPPDDVECARRFGLWIEHVYPGVQSGAIQARAAKSREITALADLRQYADEMICPDVAASTASLIRWALSVAVDTLAREGVHTVADINRFPGCLDVLRNKLSSEYKPGSVNRALYWLRATLTRAHEAGLAPAAQVKRWPKAKTREPQYKPMPSPSVIRAYWSAIERAEDKDALTFLWLTGIRPSDLCALQWTDIGEDVAIIHQRKTGKAVAIHLSSAALDILRRAKLRRQGRPLVFYNPFGRPYVPHRLYVVSVRACAKIGIEPITPKMGRQWVVTQLLDAGYAPQSIGVMTGHRSREYEKYHLMRQGSREDMASTVANALESALSHPDLSPPVTFPAKSLPDNG
jgi:integrase